MVEFQPSDLFTNLYSIMKKQNIQMLSRFFIFAGIISLMVFNSCKKDEEEGDGGTAPVASFQFEISADNFLAVVFTNYSQNATSYSWDFGDGETDTGTTAVATQDDHEPKEKTEIVPVAIVVGFIDANVFFK